MTLDPPAPAVVAIPRQMHSKVSTALQDQFVQGLVLHDHDRITPSDEKLHAGPVSMLW